MIKFFYATGDSFVFGHELNENGPEMDDVSLCEFTPHKRKHCYTGIMADKLNVEEYQNTGCPGGSNERAYRYLITDITEKLKTYKPEEIFVNVGLTHVSRREFCFDDSPSYYIHMNAFEPAKDINSHHHRLWEVLVKEFNYNYGHFMFDMMIVLGIQNFLRTNKIPYILTASMGIEHCLQESIVSPELLNQLVRNRYYVYPSFSNFAVENNCKIGPMLHPLEDGHAKWANHLFDYVQTNNLLDNSDI
jgi:hypothetical protein